MTRPSARQGPPPGLGAPDPQNNCATTRIIRCMDGADGLRSVRQRQLGVLQSLFRTLLHQLMTAHVRDLDLTGLGFETIDAQSRKYVSKREKAEIRVE